MIDYAQLLDRYHDAFWRKNEQKEIIYTIEFSLERSEKNREAFNDYVSPILAKCFLMLKRKTSQTSFSGFNTQFNSNEQTLIQRAKFILTQIKWLRLDNEYYAQCIGVEFLRTLNDGYWFLPPHPLDTFFTKEEDKNLCIENFIKYARRSHDSRDKSGEWRINETRRYATFIDYALENKLRSKMSSEQRLHFMDTIKNMCNTHDLPYKTVLFFDPTNPIDKLKFNEMIEEDFEDLETIPMFGFCNKHSMIKEASKEEFNHLSKLLLEDKIWIIEAVRSMRSN